MNVMKGLLIFGMVVCLSGLVLTSPAEAQRGYGMYHGMWEGGSGHHRGGGWSYCPYCGGRLDERDDYHGRGGHHRGRGMMMPDYDRYDRRSMMDPGYRRDYRRYDEPLKKEEAKQQVEEMLDRSRNPNLKSGNIEEKEKFFVVEIVTQDGSLADKIEVDKETGMMRSAY
ncbi:MAG: hypothetical protein PVG51_16865 [Desulfosarcina sp.]